MSKPFFVKFEVSKELADAAYEALQIAAKTGSVGREPTKQLKLSKEPKPNLLSSPKTYNPPRSLLTYLFYAKKEKSLTSTFQQKKR